MKGRCCTCRNWERFTDKTDNNEYGFCSCEKFVYSPWLPKEAFDIDGFEYSDCEAYRASFSTGELFGCIHHFPLPEGETK